MEFTLESTGTMEMRVMLALRKEKNHFYVKQTQLLFLRTEQNRTLNSGLRKMDFISDICQKHCGGNETR